MRTLLRADLALTMDDALGVVEAPEIVLEDGRIAAVRSRVDSAAAAAPGRPLADGEVAVVDLPGRWVIPGLVNAHTHAAMSLLRGYADDLPLRRWLEERIWPVERGLDAATVRAGTLLAAAEMLTAGVTTWADQYLHLDSAADVVVATGGRARLAPGLLAPLGPFAAQLDRAADLARRWHGAADDRIRVDLGPHATYTVAPEDLARVADAARDLGVGVHIHLAETRDEVHQSRTTWGLSPVQMAAEAGLLSSGCLAAHAVWVDGDDIGLLVEAGAAVAHNPRSNMRLGSGVAPLLALLQAGVTVALGTDGAASTTQLTMFEEMRAAAGLAKVTALDPAVLPARQVLQMATLGGARALRWDDEIGSLTPGKSADLVVIDVRRPGLWPVHDPWTTVVHAVQDGDVERVLVAGVTVARDRRLTTIDADEIRREVLGATDRLLDRRP